jgi:hypothetical protein
MDADLEEFNTIAAQSLVESWQVTITTAAGARLKVGKSATSVRRRPSDQGTGFIRRSEASFLFPQALTFRPDVGTQFTLTVADASAETSSVWRCFALVRGASGAPDRAECFKIET